MGTIVGWLAPIRCFPVLIDAKNVDDDAYIPRSSRQGNSLVPAVFDIFYVLSRLVLVNKGDFYCTFTSTGDYAKIGLSKSFFVIKCPPKIYARWLLRHGEMRYDAGLMRRLKVHILVGEDRVWGGERTDSCQVPTGGKLGVVFVHDADVKDRGTACFLVCAMVVQSF